MFLAAVLSYCSVFFYFIADIHTSARKLRITWAVHTLISLDEYGYGLCWGTA